MVFLFESTKVGILYNDFTFVHIHILMCGTVYGIAFVIEFF